MAVKKNPIYDVPPANMKKAFDILKSKAQDIIMDGHRYVNRIVEYGGEPIPRPDFSKIEFSYYQATQSMTIKDRNINVMVTCKFNEREEGYGLVDRTYIRPIDGAPKGIGVGWREKIGYADGAQVFSDKSPEAEAFIQSLPPYAREYTGHFADALLKIHTDKDSGIPCTHEDEYLRPCFDPEELRRDLEDI